MPDDTETQYAWVTLDTGNTGITRAARDEQGNCILQDLHIGDSTDILVYAEAVPKLRALLDGPHPALPVLLTALSAARALLDVVQHVTTMACPFPEPARAGPGLAIITEQHLQALTRAATALTTALRARAMPTPGAPEE